MLGTSSSRLCIPEKSCSVPLTDDFVCLLCQCSRRRRGWPAPETGKPVWGCMGARQALQCWGVLSVSSTRLLASRDSCLTQGRRCACTLLIWEHAVVPTACPIIAQLKYYFVCGIFSLCKVKAWQKFVDWTLNYAFKMFWLHFFFFFPLILCQMIKFRMTSYLTPLKNT